MDFEPQELNPEAYQILANLALKLPHQYRTHFTMIYGWAQLMQTHKLGELTAEQLRGLTVINTRTETSREMLDQFFDTLQVALKLTILELELIPFQHIITYLSDKQVELAFPQKLPALHLDPYWFPVALERCLKLYPVTTSQHRSLAVQIEQDWVTLDVQVMMQGDAHQEHLPDPDLFVAREIIKLHSGHLEITQSQDPGLNVIVKLPVPSESV